MQLEDVKEIIKNQNELLKEQAEEIRNLKTSLEFGLKPCNYDIINTHAYSEKSTQYEIFNHKVSVGVLKSNMFCKKRLLMSYTRKDEMKTQQPQPPPSNQNLRMLCAVFSFKGTARKKNLVTMYTKKLMLEKWSNGKTMTSRSYLQKYAGKA